MCKKNFAEQSELHPKLLESYVSGILEYIKFRSSASPLCALYPKHLNNSQN